MFEVKLAIIIPCRTSRIAELQMIAFPKIEAVKVYINWKQNDLRLL